MMNLPDNFTPLVVIGEINGSLMVYTKTTNDETMDILEQTLEVIADGSYDEEVLTLQ